MYLRFTVLAVALAGWAMGAGSTVLNTSQINTRQTHDAYAQAVHFLRLGNLPQARQLTVDAVSATVAKLPACVKTQNATFETTTYFPVGEALRFYQTVPGGRVNYYELRPDGAYRLWQAIPKDVSPKNPEVGKTVAARVFGIQKTDLAQCGQAPDDTGALAFYNDGPFNADFRYGFLQTNGKRVVLGHWQVKQNLGEIRQRGQSIFHALPGETVKR